MSELCVVNLKDYECSFEEHNNLAKQLVKYAVEKDLAVFFNNRDYMYDLIEEAGMKHYFLMSDSFLYQNCDFLSLDYYKCQEIDTEEKFARKYYFFEDIVKILLRNKVKTIEIYVSDGNFDGVEDFGVKPSSSKTIVSDLFNNVFSNKKEYDHFRSMKYIISD